MPLKYKNLLFTLMITALLFGFMHLFFPGVTEYNFERLHIFLFNLCCGGTLILHYTEKEFRPTKRVIIFFFIAIIYALSAFFKVYTISIPCALILAVIVEMVRSSKLGFIPWILLQSDKPVRHKFHQASLMCLSIGLAISAIVILNNEFLHYIQVEKLKLDIFFLGFSFPLSLITMAVMFSRIEEDDSGFIILLKNIGFWAVTLGVITFFIFILLNKLIPQVFVTTILFSAVILIFFMFVKLAEDSQRKRFLTSGMTFLLLTAITGILYIILEFFPGYPNDLSRFLLKVHTFAALYGWNIVGLSIILRNHDFPIRLHSKHLIALHWTTVIILAPAGYYSRVFAVLATISYAYFLYRVFYTRSWIQAPNDEEIAQD